MAFDSAGGYSAIWESLQQHAQEMGQYPITSFIGYGALSRLQNGMIRACVQTVADDITREWIKIEGGDGTAPEAVQALEDAVNDKYHLKDLIHKAAATVGYMGGAFIFIDTGAEGADLELPLQDFEPQCRDVAEYGSVLRPCRSCQRNPGRLQLRQSAEG